MSDDGSDELEARARGKLLRAKEALMRAKGKVFKPGTESKPPFCSFCGKGRNEIQGIVSGPTADGEAGVYICNECVALAKDIIDSRTPDER